MRCCTEPPLNVLYTLKEQLQRLWHQPLLPSRWRLDSMTGVAWLALQNHGPGQVRQDIAISPYRHLQLRGTSAHHRSLEAGNVAIGLIRKRARGIRSDTEYLKMKILQLNTPDQPSFLFHKLSGLSSV